MKPLDGPISPGGEPESGGFHLQEGAAEMEAGSYVFCASFAHVSLSVMVRLKTGAPGFESGSTAK